MVLLVPDDAEEITEDVTDDSTSGQPKAQLDDSEASKATQKVDLDLDDAPFLEDEEEEEEIEFEDETPLIQESEEKKHFDFSALFKNKLFLISLGVIALLAVVIVILLMREPEAPPPPPPTVEKVQPEEKAPEAVEEVPEILIRLDPFLVEQTDSKGQIRFLEVRIVVSTPDDGLARQFKQETYAVRKIGRAHV